MIGKSLPLSPRQMEVARLIWLGRFNREIAHLLAISVRTVEKHRQDIYARLRVRNTAELMRKMEDPGWKPKSL